MPNIPEGGAIGDDSFVQMKSIQSKPSCSQNLKESSFSQNIQKPFSWQQSSYLPTKLHTVTSKTSTENVFSQNLSNFTSIDLTDKENFYSDDIYDIENISTSVSNNFFLHHFYLLQTAAYRYFCSVLLGISQCT